MGHTIVRDIILPVILISLLSGISDAQEALVFEPVPVAEAWTVTTRWDYRVRINGRYLGHADKELREAYRRGDPVPEGWRIDGEARLLGATKKNGAPVAARLEDEDRVSYVVSRNGMILEAGDSYPRLRGFPTFPEHALQPEDTWEAPIEILVSGPAGEKMLLSQLASYRYIGPKSYMGRDAHFVDVAWATRFRGPLREDGDFLSSAEGSHRVSLVMDGETGAPIMARDALSERWVWADGNVEQRDGFALIFWDGIPPMDRGRITRQINDELPRLIAESRDNPDIDGIRVSETPRGVSITLSNLHFQPDLAAILPEDEPLLDDLARILKGIPDRTILVRGHTADVGRPDDQYSLSEERARSVADELTMRGVDPRRLIYEGVGADEPISSNADEDGRRLNRRVELLILED